MTTLKQTELGRYAHLARHEDIARWLALPVDALRKELKAAQREKVELKALAARLSPDDSDEEYAWSDACWEAHLAYKRGVAINCIIKRKLAGQLQ